MELSTAQQILVIILSSALAIFLVMAIVAAVYIIKLVKSLQHVAAKAEQVVDSVEAVGESLKRTAGSIGVLRFIRNVAHMVHKQEK